MEKSGIKADKDSCELIVKTMEMTAARQNGRIDRVELQLSETRVAQAQLQGQIGTIKADIDGEIKLIYEMLKQLSEKIALIEANTSKEQNAKRTWRIALIAAVPGVISVLIKLAEVLSGG